MESEGSLPHSQQPSTFPYPEPDRSSPCHTHPTSRRSILILSSLLPLGLPGGVLFSGFVIETLYKPLLFRLCATCPAHLSVLDHLNDMISDDEYRA
jgi:hypothetical protein